MEYFTVNELEICGLMRRYQLPRQLVEFCLSRKCGYQLLYKFWNFENHYYRNGYYEQRENERNNT